MKPYQAWDDFCFGKAELDTHFPILPPKFNNKPWILYIIFKNEEEGEEAEEEEVEGEEEEGS